jgi:hypothetical protein
MAIGAGLAAADDGAERRDTPRAVVADANGVLRYRDNGDEAAFFGVNYVAPHAYTYRALGYVGADREKTIHDDLLHLSRLGLNALRIHIWDAEISDVEGNLTPNEHLRLLDYLIAECRRRGIYVLLTPINWLGIGYPEADTPTTGFSYHYPKREMGTNPAAIAAEARFLGQLCEHINAFTRAAYRDDPVIVGIELTNEPWSPPAEQLKGYLETLAAAVRRAGCRKPIFYCASQGAYQGLTDAIGASSLEGATFGWYPSGLVSGRTLSGNFLPAVDDYPLMRDPAFARKVKAVYEFDGADLAGAYLYPAFARTFRANGAQWATQFAYCPLPLAPGNTPYQTHYMNLVYAPRQAMSLMIAGEAFRRLPRGVGYGGYPENTHFGPFRVSYERDRSEMATDTALLYANGTDTAPPKPAALERVAGCGSSPVVRYEGTGCYFLERLGAGSWRLEVYPDAIWVDDPHGAPRLDREASRVLWRTWPMTIHLPDLGPTFAVDPRNAGNMHRETARDGRFPIRPGVYLLRRPGAAAVTLPTAEFVAPPPSDRPPVVVHHPAVEAEEGEPLRISATVATAHLPDAVTLCLHNPDGSPGVSLPMRRGSGYVYTAAIPADRLRLGRLEYDIRVREGDRTRAFPSGSPFPAPHAGAPLFFAAGDGHDLRIAAGADAVALPVTPTARGPADDGDALLVRARSLDEKNDPTLAVTLVMKDGSRYSADVPLTTAGGTQRVPISALRPARGYPVRSKLVNLEVLELVDFLSVLFLAVLCALTFGQPSSKTEQQRGGKEYGDEGKSTW